MTADDVKHQHACRAFIRKPYTHKMYPAASLLSGACSVAVQAPLLRGAIVLAEAWQMPQRGSWRKVCNMYGDRGSEDL